MVSDEMVIAEIDATFGGRSKPEHFTNYQHCEECAEHDQLLRDRTNETLTIEDVGNVGWDPICFCDGEGIAYYLPALSRLALSQPTYAHGWYGDQLLFHLTCGGAENRLLTLCDVEQRRTIRRLLEQLRLRPRDLEGRLSPDDDFAEALNLWGDR